MDHTTEFQVMLLPLAALAVTIGYLRDQILCFFYCTPTKHPVVLFAKNIFNQTLLHSVVLRNTVLELTTILQNSSQIVAQILTDLRLTIVTSLQGILVKIHQLIFGSLSQIQLSITTFFQKNNGYKEQLQPYLPIIQICSLLILVAACISMIEKTGVDFPSAYESSDTQEEMPVAETRKPVRRRNRRTN